MKIYEVHKNDNVTERKKRQKTKKKKQKKNQQQPWQPHCWIQPQMMLVEQDSWLLAKPVTALGLRMDDHTLRVAVGLRLCTTIVAPHQCKHCGEEVDCHGSHGMSCRQSKRNYHRHASVNSIIHRALPL